MDMNKACERLAKAAPALSREELSSLNELFPAYIFRRRRTREVWTTCCGVHGILPLDSPILSADHTPEPKPWPVHCCHIGAMSAPPREKKPEPAACPFCGRVSPVKELGRTGCRKNLGSFRQAVVLRWYRGALWARAYELTKAYGAEQLLTQQPKYALKGVYRFAPGSALHAQKSGWRDAWTHFNRLEKTELTAKYHFSEPFRWNAECGMGYDLLGVEEVDHSPFQWCGFAAFEQVSGSLMRYLALCTAYPRQVEMLTKAGLVEVVRDFVDRKKSNARVLDWREPNPVKSFGLSRQELSAFLSGNKNMSVLYRYKTLKKAGVPADFPALETLYGQIGAAWFDKVTAKLGRYKLTRERLVRYLQKEGTAMRGRKKSGPSLAQLAGWWSDYVDAAVVLGLDLRNPVFLTPKGLMKHHDEATRAAADILEARRSADSLEKARRRCRSLSKRYVYTDGRWLIRPPVSAGEIVAEGKALRHCVGGYADRHIAGTTTILFLRDRTRPGRPLVTIQMHGAEILQIHGWDDERTGCKDNPTRQSPRKLYAAFLEPWLAWVAAGSRRDKRGLPVVPKAEKEEVA